MSPFTGGSKNRILEGSPSIKPSDHPVGAMEKDNENTLLRKEGDLSDNESKSEANKQSEKTIAQTQ